MNTRGGPISITQIETLKYFINQLEGDLEELSWEIREESNFEDNSIDELSGYYDEKKEHLDNLNAILSQFN
jgi:hemerythrin-like domain-containing protein